MATTTDRAKQLGVFMANLDCEHDADAFERG